MDPLFVLDERFFGRGPLVYAWEPAGELLAACGTNRKVHLFNGRGVIQRTLTHASNACTALAWNAAGTVLAIGQANSSAVLLWERKDGELRELDLGLKEVSLLLWSRAENVLAIGTSKGVVFIYDHDTDTKIMAGGRHKRRIISADWLGSSSLAYASEDKQISMCTSAGILLDQVKVKCLPMDVAFGGKEFDEHSIVSVNMEGKTILLYNATEKDNALELAFQAKYGSIVAYNWFSDGYIVAGFSSGFVVVISTRVNEIGREQFCARFQKKSLRDIKHSSDSNRIACCGDSCVKVIDMQGWVEECTQRLPEEAGSLGTLEWAAGGRQLSVASDSGTLYTFSVRTKADEVASLTGTLFLPVARPLSPACVFCGFCAILLSGAVFAAATYDLPLALLVGELLTPTSL